MRLKQIRKEKGISQLKLAIELNTNQNTISRYETGEREPGINELIRIADYFNVSIDYLLERTDNPKMQRWNIGFKIIIFMRHSIMPLFFVYFLFFAE